MVPPSDVCGFINPMNTIVTSAINHSEMGVICTNLANELGHHLVAAKILVATTAEVFTQTNALAMNRWSQCSTRVYMGLLWFIIDHPEAIHFLAECEKTCESMSQKLEAISIGVPDLPAGGSAYPRSILPKTLSISSKPFKN